MDVLEQILKLELIDNELEQKEKEYDLSVPNFVNYSELMEFLDYKENFLNDLSIVVDSFNDNEILKEIKSNPEVIDDYLNKLHEFSGKGEVISESGWIKYEVNMNSPIIKESKKFKFNKSFIQVNSIKRYNTPEYKKIFDSLKDQYDIDYFKNRSTFPIKSTAVFIFSVALKILSDSYLYEHISKWVENISNPSLILISILSGSSALYSGLRFNSQKEFKKSLETRTRNYISAVKTLNNLENKYLKKD